MKHNSKKRKKKRVRKGVHKKRGNDMKNPFVITVVVLVLFVILVIFSIVKGPVEEKPTFDESGVQSSVERRNIVRPIEPTVNINFAIANDDISKCDGDNKCEDWYYFSKVKVSEDCDEIKDEEIKNNCKDNFIFEESEDESICLNKGNAELISLCFEELK